VSDQPEPRRGQRWAALRAAFEEFADLGSAERQRRLAALGEADPDLADALHRMLAADAAPSGVLERSAAEVAAAVLRTELGGATSDAGSPSDLTGLRLGAWRLRERLGQGGMGEVWLAERADGGFEQQAAIKVIKRGMDSEEVLRRFRRERQILARLEHPHIARLLDGGVAPDGRPYFVLERVRGATILDWAERENLGVEARIALILQAAEGVEFAHRNLVVHRDLKPSNILVAEDGQVKLLDFGIAKLLDPGEDADVTRTAAMMLTPRYAAPEQILGEPATTATDVYALGAVLYELLVGELPHRRASTAADLVRAAAHETIERPSAVVARAGGAGGWRRRLTGDLDTILLRALAREPARRYPSVAALAEDLRRHLDGRPVLARADTRGYRLAKFVGRHRAVVAAASLALASLVAGLGVALVKERAARAQATRAQAAQEFLSSLFLLADPDQAQGAKLSARDLLDRGAARVDVALAGQPELLAEMLGLLGKVYVQLGVYAEAERLYQRALDLELQRLGPESPRLAESYRLLGGAMHRQAKYPAARPMMERALALYQRRGDELAASGALQDLALLTRAQGDNEQARGMLLEVVSVRSRLGEPDSPDLAKALNNLGLVLWREKRYRAAAVVFKRSLAIHRKHEGEVSSLVAGTEENLAMVLNLAGDGQAARPHIESAVYVLERLFDRPHPKLANALSSAGYLAAGRGELERAAELYHRSIAVYEAAEMAHHPDASYPLRHLGALRAKMGDQRAALEHYQRALGIRERAFGLEHRLVAETLIDVADAQQALGDLAGAEASLRRALAVNRVTAGPKHETIAQTLLKLGELLLTLDRRVEAASALEECLSMRREVLPAGDPGIREAEETLARIG
jgi:eukaryotic-like serine/threonine-protein kinase